MQDYLLMNKNTPTLKFEMDSDGRIYNMLDVIDSSRVPLGVKGDNGVISRKLLSDWWSGRSIPASRAGFSQVMMDLRIGTSTALLVKCNGLSLNDQYWVKEVNSTLDWNSMNFFDNDFSEDMGKILFGESIINADFKSPDNSSDGWLKKRWKIINGDRVLIKAGSGESLQEPLNEVFTSIINKRTGFKNAEPYWLVWDNEGRPYSACKNFINTDTELISAYYLTNSVKKSNNISDFNHYVNCCNSVGISDEVTREFMSYMFTLDYLVQNQDRHYNNFGIIKDANSLEVLGHAPIFDTGTSLWNGVATHLIGSSRYDEAKPFRKTHEEQIKTIGKSEWFTNDRLYGTEDELNDLLKKSEYVSIERRDALVRCYRQRITRLLGMGTVNSFN